MEFHTTFDYSLRQFLSVSEVSLEKRHKLLSSRRKKIMTIVKDDLQAKALLNFDAHKEHSSPAWWLRVLSKNNNGFFPSANTSKAAGYCTLHNYPPNNWEPIEQCPKLFGQYILMEKTGLQKI